MIVAKTKLKEIPKECKMCTFIETKFNCFYICDEYGRCSINYNVIDNVMKRPYWCPLIEVNDEKL